MGVQERAGTDEQRACAALDEGRKGWLDLGVTGDTESDAHRRVALI
jgi:hypothetical protein